jgi:hypothetical protein
MLGSFMVCIGVVKLAWHLSRTRPTIETLDTILPTEQELTPKEN